MNGRGGGWRRRVGLLLSVLLWAASIAALVGAVRANEAAGFLAREHGRAGTGVRVEHLHGVAVMWAVLLTALQIAALLVGTGVLRVGYRLRSAVCFAVSGGMMALLNCLWLFGLLVFLRIHGDTR